MYDYTVSFVVINPVGVRSYTVNAESATGAVRKALLKSELFGNWEFANVISRTRGGQIESLTIRPFQI